MAMDSAREADAAQGSSRGSKRQARRWTVADVLTVSRIPLAALFVVAPDRPWRIVILVAAGVTDLIDGVVARRWGGSRLGAFLDPVADKLFMAAAFGVVLFSGRLHPLEIVGVLARDIMAAAAFAATVVLRRPASIPARVGGKMVTIGQLLTLLAFLTGSSYLRPMAWATAGMAAYAIWDYARVALRDARRLDT
jgi:CDP-diacylglycerol---glycerol-3-phosphate 3-phosphatidyltransferase